MSIDCAPENHPSRALTAGYPSARIHFHRSRELSDAADFSGWSPGRLNGCGWAASGRLHRLATGQRTRRCARLHTQVREDLLDHWLFQDHRNDLQLATAVRPVLYVDVAHALEQAGQHHQLNRLRPVVRQCPLVAGTSQSGAQVERRKPVIQGGPARKILSGSPAAGYGREPLVTNTRSKGR